MKKLVIAVLLVSAAIIASLFAYVFYAGPRMKVQAHIRTYQAFLPGPPEGTLPVKVSERLSPAERAAALTNPLPPSKAATERGRVYYHYYCVFCHGEEGDGNGPVGQSYVPAPSDLRSAKIRGLSDGLLLRAMLTGIGHEPVLERVVLPEHRWYIVSYVRSLKR